MILPWHSLVLMVLKVIPNSRKYGIDYASMAVTLGYLRGLEVCMLEAQNMPDIQESMTLNADYRDSL